MKNRMLKVIAYLLAVVVLLHLSDLLLGNIIEKNNLNVLAKILDVAFIVGAVLLIFSIIIAAILNVKECVRKDGRQYIDKFLLKVICIFVFLFMINQLDTNYIDRILYPALAWIIIPRAYDFVTSNE